MSGRYYNRVSAIDSLKDHAVHHIENFNHIVRNAPHPLDQPTSHYLDYAFNHRRQALLASLWVLLALGTGFALSSWDAAGACYVVPCVEGDLAGLYRVSGAASFQLALTAALFVAQPFYGLLFLKARCSAPVAGAYIAGSGFSTLLALVSALLWSTEASMLSKAEAYGNTSASHHPVIVNTSLRLTFSLLANLAWGVCGVGCCCVALLLYAREFFSDYDPRDSHWQSIYAGDPYQRASVAEQRRKIDRGASSLRARQQMQQAHRRSSASSGDSGSLASSGDSVACSTFSSDAPYDPFLPQRQIPLRASAAAAAAVPPLPSPTPPTQPPASIEATPGNSAPPFFSLSPYQQQQQQQQQPESQFQYHQCRQTQVSSLGQSSLVDQNKARADAGTGTPIADNRGQAAALEALADETEAASFAPSMGDVERAFFDDGDDDN